MLYLRQHREDHIPGTVWMINLAIKRKHMAQNLVNGKQKTVAAPLLRKTAGMSYGKRVIT